MQVLAHRAVGVELPERRRLRAGAAQRVQHLRRTETHQRSRRSRRTERRHRARRVEEVVVAGVDRLADAERGLVADRHRREKRAAIHVFALGNRQRRGNDRRRRVNRRSLVNVVELEDVRGDAIGERRDRR